jgi:hypothetical protein
MMDEKELSIIYKCMNNYEIKLSIIDHIREISWIYDNEYKPTKNADNLNKELIDLKIILDMLFCSEDKFIELYKKRLDKFYAKSKKNERMNKIV